jgi:hypothetical protein
MADRELRRALREVRRDGIRQARARTSTKDESEDGSAAAHLADDAIRAISPLPWRRASRRDC